MMGHNFFFLFQPILSTFIKLPNLQETNLAQEGKGFKMKKLIEKIKPAIIANNSLFPKLW